MKQTRWYGPEVGGLFLAFPAIFCASATLIASHAKQRKQTAGLAGDRRGKDAAALDSAGAALGSIGLLAFAVMFRLVVPHAAWLVTALAAWAVVSIGLWLGRKRPCRA